MMVQRGNPTFHSGELAKATGVSPDTIRHYEKIGVLPKAVRSASGYRIYPESAVERVHVVQRALRIGFTLSELAEVLKARDAGGAPCQRVFELAQQKLVGIKTDIAALMQTERYLEKVLTDWKSRVRRAGRGQKAYLLHSLTEAVKDVSGRTKFRRKRR
jgi:DNA-binding transcriptional MerR regulator